MEEPSHLLQLPKDILLEHILIPQLQDEAPEKTLLSIQKVNKYMKNLCNSQEVLSKLNLNNHFVFDSTKDMRYVHFILHCADKGNTRASLLYGLSMGFCYGQHEEAVKYLFKAKQDWCVAEYAYGIIMIENPKTRNKGMAVLKKVRQSGTEHHLHLCRIQMLQLLQPGLHFNRTFRTLHYNCQRGPECHRRRHSKLIRLDGNPMVMRCSDQTAAAIEYNVVQKAIVTRHSHTLPS